MRCKKIFSQLLLALQILQLFGAPVILASHEVVDAAELMDINIPTKETFAAIKKQWIRVNLNKKNKPINYELSEKKLAKLAGTSSSKKTKINERLLNASLDFFEESSPQCDLSTKFTKPRDWEDLQLYSGKITLLESISRTILTCGMAYTGALVAQRPQITATLERRDFIGCLVDKKDLADELRKPLINLAKHEETLFSTTMQPEDLAVKVALEDLAPGFLLRQLPKKLISENPEFIRFHALLTQKTAPILWTPLMTLKEGGMGPYFPFGFMLLLGPNGIAQTLFKDFVAYSAHQAEIDPDFDASVFDPTDEWNTHEKKWKKIAKISQKWLLHSSIYGARCAPGYVKNHLCAKGHRTNTFLGLLNDTFLWHTNELRFSRSKHKVAENTGPSLQIQEPTPLGAGPHRSIWMNGQYNKNVLWKLLYSIAAKGHKKYWGEDVPAPGSPITLGFINILKRIMRNQIAVAATINGPLGRTAHTIDAALTAADAINSPLEAAGKLATATKDRFFDFFGGWLRRIHHEADAINAARAGAPAAAPIPGGLPIPGGPLPAAPPAEQQDPRDAALKQLTADLVNLLGQHATASTNPKKKPWQPLFAALISWVLASYLWKLWRSRNDAQKARVNDLDKIMFAAVKPAMVLLSATSSIEALLAANKNNIVVPSSLQEKLTLYKALCETKNKEFIKLSTKRTFTKDTGHKILDHTGEVRRAYNLLQKTESRTLLELAIHILAELDSYLGIASLAKEYSEGDNQLCPVHFIKSDKPFINAKNAWFSLLGKNAIGSDILMGNGNATNILLTGLNGGGKSIMLKTCVFTIVLAHIFGWTTAQQCSMSPIAELNLHMSSLDNAAEGKSRWVAEAEAIVSMINCAEALHSPDYFILVLGDELGDGTAPDASLKVMIKLIRVLCSKQHSLSFISSHLQPLTELEKTLQGITNYRISPQRKLIPGINTTSIAVEIFNKFSNTKQKEGGFAAALANQTSQPHITMVTGAA